MITIYAKSVQSFFQKARGLIGKTQPEVLFFQTRWGIHTFGLRFPIDVVILNDKYTVVTFKQNLKPNRIFLWNPKYKNVIELPNGKVKRLKIMIRSNIRLTPITY